MSASVSAAPDARRLGRFHVSERAHDGAWMVSTRMPDPCADPVELTKDGILPSLRWVILFVHEDRKTAFAWARQRKDAAA